MGSTYLFRLNEGVPSIPGCPYPSLETTKLTKNDESAPGLKRSLPNTQTLLGLVMHFSFMNVC